MTLHRAENIDNHDRAKEIVEAINEVSKIMPIIFSVHPHTSQKFQQYGLNFSKRVIEKPSMGFFEFVKLEKHARVVLTDSGTVPEETSIFGVSCVILRRSTERQELLENGGVVLAGVQKKDIIESVKSVLEMKQDWRILEDYAKMNVSETIIRLLLGQRKIEI